MSKDLDLLGQILPFVKKNLKERISCHVDYEWSSYGTFVRSITLTAYPAKGEYTTLQLAANTNGTYFHATEYYGTEAEYGKEKRGGSYFEEETLSVAKALVKVFLEK